MGTERPGVVTSAPSWRRLIEDPAQDRHIVQFYEDPSFLQDLVGAWTAQGLRRHGGALLIATPQHAALVRAWLDAQRFDTRALEHQGRLLVLDAEATLVSFMIAGVPDRARFRAAVDEALARVRHAAGDPAADVRAWGEMVSVLWTRGSLPAAQRLEGLWNEALDAQGFHLLCSYRVSNLDPATHRGLLLQLAGGHTQLIPARDTARLDEAVAQAMVQVFGASEARSLAALFTARQSGGLGMPVGEAVLVGLHQLMPQLGPRVILLARKAYEGAEEERPEGAGAPQRLPRGVQPGVLASPLGSASPWDGP